MYTQTRRFTMIGGLTFYLTGCGTNPNTTPLQMAQEYGSALVAALQNAATQLLAQQPPLSANTIAIIQKVQADLQLANSGLSSATLPATAIDFAKQLIASAQLLSPIVAPLLGPFALYLPLALSVLQTFVDQLPPPPAAPVAPPPELKAAARAKLVFPASH